MKSNKIFILALFLVFLIAGNTFAITFGPDNGSSLQGVLDNITVGGDSSIDVTTDYYNDTADSTWSQTASGGSLATMIIELAGFANKNTFGVYDNGEYVELFTGSQGAGDQAILSIKADGSVFVNFSDTGVDFTGNSFGFYLDSRANGSAGGLFHSDTNLNDDGVDHMIAFQGNDSDIVQLPNLNPGLWTDNEFILAFEDLNNGGDRDYTDFVLMVESVQPVPEPATLFLIGSGLIGLAGVRRKKNKL